MTPAFKPLVQGSNDPTVAMTNSAATYYTVPAAPDNTITHVRGLILCNTDSSARTVRVHNVASGDSVAAANAIFYDLEIAAKQTVKVCFDEGHWVMTAGMTIQALADTGSVVTITLSGQEVAP